MLAKNSMKLKSVEISIERTRRTFDSVSIDDRRATCLPRLAFRMAIIVVNSYASDSIALQRCTDRHE